MNIRYPRQQRLCRTSKLLSQILHSSMKSLRSIPAIQPPLRIFQQIPIKHLRNPRRMLVRNRPHRRHHTAVPSRQHPSRQVHRLLRELVVPSARLACGHEREVGVWEILLHDLGQHERAVVQVDGALEGVGDFLGGVACEVDAGEGFHGAGDGGGGGVLGGE